VPQLWRDVALNGPCVAHDVNEVYEGRFVL